MRYTELRCKSNFSFLLGASHPHELIETAHRLGYSGLSLTDMGISGGISTPTRQQKTLAFPSLSGLKLTSVMAHPWLSGQSIDQDTVECAA